MPIQLIDAHTGQSFLLDAASLDSLESLRACIASTTSIPRERQIVMTSEGRNVKLHMLSARTLSLFVYDRRYLSPTGHAVPPVIAAPEPWHVDAVATNEPSQSCADCASWLRLLELRRDWAVSVASQCSTLHAAASQTYGKVLNIERADLAATRNLSTHLGGMEEEVRARRAWLDTTVDRDARIIAAWDTIAQAVKCIPTPMDFRFLQQNGAKTSDCGRVTGSLLDYVPPEWHHETSSSLSAAIEGLSHTVGTLEARFASIRQEVQRCMQPASYEPISHKVDALHGDIDRIVSTIQADYAHAQKLPRTMSSVPILSRVAASQSSEVLSRLINIGRELHGTLTDAINNHRIAQAASIATLRKISQAQSRLADVQTLLADVDHTVGFLRSLQMVVDLPSLYGAVLVEAMRRAVWSTHVATQHSAAATQSRSSQKAGEEDESERRKRWSHSMRGFIHAQHEQSSSFNLQVWINSDWPCVSQHDIESYLQHLGRCTGLRHAYAIVREAYDDLMLVLASWQIPSVHCTRPDTSSEVDARQAETEEVQQLKQENTLLEGRLRGAETRIRRLEDLLHRQGEQGRPISAYNGHTGDQFQPRGLCWRSHEQPLLYESQVMHLRQLNESLQDRLSSEQEGTARLQTELALRLEQEEAEAYDLRQVVESLKSELDKERSTVAQLEAAAAAEREANAATLQDAVSIKRDLLRNIQAQQREFEHERKELEEEIRSLTQKLEEAEDHLEADDKERVDQQVKYAVLSEELLRVQAEHLELMTSAKLQASLAAQERVVRDMLRDCLQQCYATLVPEGDSTDERAMCEQLISVACRAEGRSNDQWLSMCARETSVRLHSTLRQLYRMMEQLGYVCGREGQNEPLIVRRVRHAEDHTSEPQAPMQTTPAAIVPSALNPELHDWAMRQSSPSRQDGYARFVAAVDEFPTASIVSNIVKRMQAIEEVARKWRKKGRAYREQFHRAQAESRSKIAFCEYHVGDLALFLPTKNQPQKAWAAFNVNAPHRFLRFADPRSLASRDWLVARITKIEEHIVDSSRSLDAADGDASSLVAQASGRLSAVSAGECSAILEPQWSEDNPFGFSEGQRWYYLDAVEERQVTSVAGAPTTPGPSKSTVATAAVDVKGNVQVVKSASSRPATAEASPSCASNRDRDSRTSPSQHRLKTTEGPKN